jgi:hypothetical protein
MEIKPLILYEPIHQSRFIIRFPKEFGIKEYLVQKMSPLKYNFATGWEDITISMIDIIAEKITKCFSENIIKTIEGRITLEKLDPTGVCVEKIHIDSKFIDVDFGKFNYASDKLNKIVVKIKPVRVIVE